MGRFWIYWTYHKDSFAAHKRDSKTGYEGRYRRTYSPSASSRNLFDSNHTYTQLNGNLRSAVSTSSLLKHESSSLLGNEDINDLANASNETSFNNNDEVNAVNRNNEWTSHLRQVSTTVNFTTEELRAFKNRKRDKDVVSPVLYSPRDSEKVPSLGGTVRTKESSPEPCDNSNKQTSWEEVDKSSSRVSLNSLLTGTDNNSISISCTDNNDVSLTCTDNNAVSTITGTENNNLISSHPDLSHDGPITAHPATVTEESSFSESTDSSPQSSFTKPLGASTSLSSLVVSSTTFTMTKDSYRSSLSGTCPSMTSHSPPDDDNIVVLGYGRTPSLVEVSCERLGRQFVQSNKVDSELFTLFAPDSDYKSAGSYMKSVFSFELRQDLLADCHAQHPDLKRNSSPHNQTSEEQKINTTGSRDSLTADYVYFSTSDVKERKVKLLESIAKKLEILRIEENSIKEEIAQNGHLGTQISAKVEHRSKPTEFNKFKLHVSEIEKITSLFLGLSGRLARVENSLSTTPPGGADENDSSRRILEVKKEKLEEQLEEAKKLKENIDRRAVQIARILAQYLAIAEYADYDHFIKMKAKLLLDSREITDKISLGHEQLSVLKKH